MSTFNGEVINILGTPYKIISDNYNLIEQDRDGVCDVYERPSL